MATKTKQKAIERLLDAKDSLTKAGLVLFNLNHSAKVRELVGEIDTLINSLCQEQE